jgi:hypothetical protein
MRKKQRKKLARQIVKQVLHELSRTPAPEPAPRKKTPKEQAAAILDTAREYTRTSARLAGWTAESGDALMDAGYSPCAADRAFADALQVVQ